MDRERRLTILARLADDQAAGSETKRLCQVCADVTAMTGAGIMLMAGDVPRGTVCTTDNVSALIEQLQFDLGEGPCVDAYRLDRPVLEPDLARPVAARWVAFAPPALAAGVRAVFGFPLQVGTARLGALNLYRDTAGSLDQDQQADALAMADIAAEAILLLQAEALEAGGEFPWVIHQAAGMVAAQMDVNVTDALAQLRAYAFGNGLSLTDVARAVVNRNLRFPGRGK